MIIRGGVRADSRLEALQGLRLLAALLVVVDHTIGALARHGTPVQYLVPWAEELGCLGVVIFFAISGFVMVITNRDQFGRSGASVAFIKRRLIRIVPLYWTMTFVAFAVQGHWDAVHVELLIRSLLFLPMACSPDLVAPTLGLGWTLNYEIFFYGLFMLALPLAFARGVAAIVATIGILCLAGHLLRPQIQLPYGSALFLSYYLHSILQYFVYGVLLGAAWVTWPAVRSLFDLRLAAFLNVLTIAISVALLAGDQRDLPIGTHAVYIPAAVLTVAFAAMARPSRTGALSVLLSSGGDASYSIYLTHWLLVGPIGVIWSHCLSTVPWPLALVVSIVLSTATGALIHRVIEAPILGRLRERADDASCHRAQARAAAPSLKEL